MNTWNPGDPIILREVWKGKAYSITPVRIVFDTPQLVAMYFIPNTPSKFPVGPNGDYLRLPRDEWTLRDEIWCKGDALYLNAPGDAHTAIAFYKADHSVDHWKVNLEIPMRRTRLGFDYMDQFLDVIVNADCTEWHWKDEDELAKAVAEKIISADQAIAVRAEGERVIELVRAKKPPFDGRWNHWSPDPKWKIVPELPKGWDIVD